jgi:hypothetical protein
MNRRASRVHIIKPGKPARILPEKESLDDRKAKIEHKDESYLELTELVTNSVILFKARAVFPFSFFPNEIIIDKDKVSIVTQSFFASDRHQSLLIKNIADCYVDTSIFFGSVNISDKYYEDNIISINYLKKRDAVAARNIIQGLALCQEKEVDISEIKPADLLPYLIEIGKATEY